MTQVHTRYLYKNVEVIDQYTRWWQEVTKFILGLIIFNPTLQNKGHCKMPTEHLQIYYNDFTDDVV